MIRKTKHCYKKPNSSSKPVSAIHLIDIYECLVIVIFLSFPSVFLLLLLSTLCMEFSVKIWQSLQRKISLYKSVIRRKVGVSTSPASRHQNWYLATIVFRSSFCCEVTRFVVGQPENVVSCSTFRQKENFTQFKLHAVKREKYNVTGIKIYAYDWWFSS